MHKFFRWVPFLFIFIGLATLAEVGVLRRSFLAEFGPEAWDRLHFYGSAVLVYAAYRAQSRRWPRWQRLLVAVIVVLAVGVLREVRQSFDVGPRGFSRHDIQSDIQGTVVGAAVSMFRSVVGRVLRRRVA